MVGNSGEYVLQWDGHARNVTERFSALFARQSLVDVTLICEEQRLRVHKLVLASCSVYFEEMLEQDLGQEPTILLSDLNFEVLKAMVEFMYCGETSISEQHLEPLLHAARVFKVKELACIAENMMGPTNTEDEQVTDLSKEDANDLEETNDYSLFSDIDCLQGSKPSKIGTNELSGNELEETGYKNSGSIQMSQSDETYDDMLRNLEPTLYQEETDIENVVIEVPLSEVPLSLAEIAYRKVVKFYNEIPIAAKLHMQTMSLDNERIDNAKVFINERKKFQTVLYEQCCDFVNNERSSKECSQFVPEEKPLDEFKEINRTVDKCLKVYTHKRRKSAEGLEKQFVKIIDDLPELPISGNCIDLTEEPSKNETELENDYILSLSNVNVETIIDFVNSSASADGVYSDTRFDDNTIVNYNKEPRQMKEIFSNNNRIISNGQSDKIICKSRSLCVPALRRSVRLIHQENEDATNNNNSVQDLDRAAKDLRRESSRRKNKGSDLDCESDENKASQNSLTKRLDTPRSLRNTTSKLIKRRRSKSRLSFSKSSVRSEDKTRVNNKATAIESSESFSNRFNTIATVSRALWGDMSDCLENTENNIDFSDYYSSSKEIPFAVGLLPLRAALERMQAMPDYQPRKTRSSVTPLKQEFIKGVKRKNFTSNNNNSNNNNNIIDTNNGNVKRQSNGNNLGGNTVCHVRITTSHSQSVKPGQRSINEQVDAAISPTGIVNRQ